MKVFIAGLSTETNTFAPMPTGYANYAETRLIRDGDYGDRAPVLAKFRERAEERGWAVVSSLCTSSQPAGPTVRAVYESFRDEILTDLRAALPVDMVLLGLHGAMVADGYDDCEGDIVSRAREIVGPGVPIGVELDLHCHLTELLVRDATAIVIYKEYPHIDVVDRAEELFDIIAAAAAGKIKPAMSLFDCRMIGLYRTTEEPMKSMVARCQALEQEENILSVSIAHGFPWADVPELGTRTLVVTDDMPELGDRIAEELGQELFAQREALRPSYVSIEEGLTRAQNNPASPVVLADATDNAGGGAASDSTFVIRAMLERGIDSAVVGCIWDPIAVSIAMDAGVGAELDLRIGGKIGPQSGDPVDLRVKVIGVKRDARQSFGPASVKMGDAVAVNAQGIDLVLNSIRVQTFSPSAFTEVGIDPLQRHILVAKSMHHFYAGFAPIAAEVIHVDAPGTMVTDFTQIPYTRINPNMWPLVEAPFA